MGGFDFFGGRMPPFFYEKLTPSDAACVERQMDKRRFDPALMLGTTARCRFGFHRVLVCSPLDKGLKPFPTTFWLSCPWLVRRIGTLESGGGVKVFEGWLTRVFPGEWRGYNRDHQRLRLALLGPAWRVFLHDFKPKIWDRLRLSGVGGIRYGFEINVKCLHLQAASWLALRRHPGAVWFEREGLAGDCGTQFCDGLR